MVGIHRKRDHRQILIGGVILWATFVSLFFMWQVVQYKGIMAQVAEWQFNSFGHYYSSATYLATVMLLAAPGLLLFLGVRHRGSDQRLAEATLRSAIIFRRTLLGVAAACLVAATVTLLLVLTLPRAVGTPNRIDLGQPVLSLPREGATTMTGAVLYDRTAAFEENVLVARHTLRFAPMVAPQPASADLQFFVELPSEAVPQIGAVSSMRGVLRRDGLPGEIVQLFRYAGYRVEPPHYVLFASEATMRWPYFKVAEELALVALLFLVLGFFQHRRTTRLDDAVRDPVAAPPAPAPEATTTAAEPAAPADTVPPVARG